MTGLGIDITESIFNHDPQVRLGKVKAGIPRHPALWLADQASGATVYLRVTVKIGDETWGAFAAVCAFQGLSRWLRRSVAIGSGRSTAC
ncbi:hypothetical protein ACI2LF_33090 [Kribbella sp. NPDC020789]